MQSFSTNIDIFMHIPILL